MDAVRISPLGATALGSPKAVPSTLDLVSLVSGTEAQAVASEPIRELALQAVQASTAILQGGAQAASALGLNSVPSVLAALTPPQAAAPSAATTASSAVPVSNVAAAALAATEVPSPSPLPDTTGSGLDFALQTALRFGAGVGPLGMPLNRVPDLSAGLVRDASAVLRANPLQPRTGGPGPEAFGPSAFAQQAARFYRGAPTPASEVSRLDLLA